MVALMGIAPVAAPLHPSPPEPTTEIAATLPQRDQRRDRDREAPDSPPHKQKREEKPHREGLGAHIDLQV